MSIRRKSILAGLAAIALIGGGVLAWHHFAGSAALPEGLIQANGRIEGDHTTVASKLPGRIALLKAREGDVVVAGQVLAQLEDTQLAARKLQAEAAVATLQAQLQSARAQLAIARREVPLATASADAVLGKARAAEVQAARDAGRFDELAARGTVEPRRAEQMRLAHTAAAADLRQAEQALSASRLGSDKVKARGVLQPQNKAIKPTDVVLTIAYATGPERITLGADGSFELNPSPQAVQENPMVFTNMPKGEKAGLGINMFAALPAHATQFSYGALMGDVPQANALIKSQAGMLSLFVPTLTGVLVRFAKPGPQTLTIATKGGAKTLTTDTKGQIALKLDDALMTENPMVTASAPVLEAEIDAVK